MENFEFSIEGTISWEKEFNQMKEKETKKSIKKIKLIFVIAKYSKIKNASN
ncbi:MAG: hypothetical protein KBD00_00655 [Candidatus Peribacteraceae bacterium]|nr:hypothetical protein [Candidatus Peribacteraceae bacterium]